MSFMCRDESLFRVHETIGCNLWRSIASCARRSKSCASADEGRASRPPRGCSDGAAWQLKDCGAYQSENRGDARQTPPRGGVVPLHRNAARRSSRVDVYFLSEICDGENGLLSVQFKHGHMITSATYITSSSQFERLEAVHRKGLRLVLSSTGGFKQESY